MDVIHHFSNSYVGLGWLKGWRLVGWLNRENNKVLEAQTPQGLTFLRLLHYSTTDMVGYTVEP